MQKDCNAVHAKHTAFLISTHEQENEVTAIPLAKLIEKRRRKQRPEQREKKW